MSSKKSLASRIKKVSRNGVIYYKCNYTRDGKQRVKESRNRKVIRDFLEDYDRAIQDLGKLSQYDPAEVGSWAKLAERAKQAGTNLEDCVTYYLAKLEEQTTVREIHLKEALSLYLNDKEQDWQKITFKNAKNKLMLFYRNQGNITLSALTPIAFINSLIKAGKSTTYIDNIRRNVSSFLNWCIETKTDEENEKFTYNYLDVNPLVNYKVKAKGVKSKVICTLSPLETKLVLQACIHNYDHRVCPQIILSIFAGIRPSEFRKKVKYDDGTHRTHALTWSALLDKPEVTISKELAKTCARTTPKSEALTAWLEWLKIQRSKHVQELEEIQKSRTVTTEYWNKDHIRQLELCKYVTHPRFKFHRQNWLAANPKIKEILHGKVDILRHTYGTYTAAKSLVSYSILAKWMGNSEAICKDHYVVGDVTGEEANAVFNLTPEVLQDEEKELKVG